MTRAHINEIWPIMEAFKNGDDVEYLTTSKEWQLTSSPTFAPHIKYRLKPVHNYQFLLKSPVPPKDLKVGTELIAIDICRMNSGCNSLTIGKQYIIYKLNDNLITLVDDKDEKHGFTFDRILFPKLK